MLKQRYGAEYLPAVPHERKELYLQSVSELNDMKINPNRIANDLIAAYNSAERVRLSVRNEKQHTRNPLGRAASNVNEQLTI